MHVEIRTEEGELSWSRSELTAIARGRTGHVPPEALVALVIEMNQGGDWPVMLAGVKAVLRRCDAAERDELIIASRPKGRAVLGTYSTRRKGRRGGQRPYDTRLDGVDPIRGCCSCSDFLRSSLGICKHLFVVLDHVHASHRKLERAKKAQADRAAPPAGFDPRRPLHEAGGLLHQIRVEPEGATLPVGLTQWAVKSEDPAAQLARIESLEKGLGSKRYRALAPEPDPSLLAVVHDARARLKREKRAAAVRARLDVHLSTLRRPLYSYQLEGVRRFFERGRLLLADDMGLGKTTQSAAIAHASYRSRLARRGLVVVPASLKSQWMTEWSAVSDTPAEIVVGSPEVRRSQYAAHKAGFLILNYELVVRDLPQLIKMSPELVILDEAQRIKNWHTKTARSIKRLSSPYRLVLTGTPMENRLDELASIMDWIDDVALEPKWRIPAWYVKERGDGGFGRSGARNLDNLRARLAPTLVRRVRQDVIKELPPRTDTAVPVAMTPLQAERHHELTRPIAALAQIRARRALTPQEFTRLMQLLTNQRVISNGLAQADFDEVWPALESNRPSAARLDALHSPKLREFRDLVESLVVDQGRKLVVFSQWRRMLRLADWVISDLLESHGLRAVFFTGAESLKLRTQGVAELHDDPKTCVMFLSDAGGIGLNLQRAASCCINLEIPWNPAVLEQRIARIYRLGQREPIDVFNLVGVDSIEARIARGVGDKQALFSGLFDGTSNEIVFDGGSLFAQLLDAVVPPDVDPILTEAEEEGIGLDDDLASPTPEKVDDDRIPSARSGAPLDLLGALEIRRSDDGGLTLKAPPEAADAIAGLLEGLATMLRSSAAER